MNDPQGFLWHDGVLLPDGGREPSDVLVADSWSLDGGRVLALDVHRERFVGSLDPELRAEASAFWDAVLERAPREGSWFPRIRFGRHSTQSADAGPAFHVLFRPASVAPDFVAPVSARLVTASHDPRTQPLVKGPDLERLAALRSEAQNAGADEAVILSPEGLVVEGNYSSVVWWRGDVLCRVADELPRLPGVTERSLVTLAAALGTEIESEIVAAGDLDGLEVWILDSRYGARIATSWADGPRLAEQPGRLRLWRSRLAALKRPVAS